MTNQPNVEEKVEGVFTHFYKPLYSNILQRKILCVYLNLMRYPLTFAMDCGIAGQARNDGILV